ncbi:hypothetical protein [Geodermatophilus normandii]|uniref:hypothetical protein n=1 Tax=Geodermatophilus normandii TaxID=1137989 RepID=UPI000D718F96|nr:hypothetical protein [Geodermatophilus normandii]
MLQTCVLLTVTALTYALVSVGAGRTSVLSTREWFVWRFAASLGVGLAWLMALRSVRDLRPAARRVGTRLTGRDRLGYALVTAVLVLGVFLFLYNAGQMDRTWQIAHMEGRLAGVVLAVGVTGVPWVYLLLTTSATLGRWEPHHRLAGLLESWDVLVRCLTVFAVLVVISLVPTGALRALWLAQRGDTDRLADQFPASDVLLYGAFFTVVLAAITLPVVAAWRTEARRLVAHVYPVTTVEDLTDDWDKGRKRLEEVLHLDKGILRNPLTAFTVFTPLLTSVLAGFVPGLAAS